MKNNKSLGQHWLKDRAILDEIAELTLGNASESPLDAPETRLCLEIGPGLGTLTSSLLRVFPRVVAVEFDENLAKNLPKSFPGKDLTVVNADFLKFDLNSIERPYVVAGNIPYYITSPIIMKLLETENRPDNIVLLIQKEVAERIAAKAGKHTVLSLSIQNLADVELGPVVKKDLFTPPPKVDSQVIILRPKNHSIISTEALNLAKRAFSAPRKKLIKNLSSFYSVNDLKEALPQVGLDPNCRPSDSALETWQKLYEILQK
ncbi:ribosomal RNA small subunit methyltransferase A [Candidatus Saccharibacteria bacterium]|nr:ribosomal RNA small subunit methyltransferase A [Candidatus Saccharibacteria bacterium]